EVWAITGVREIPRRVAVGTRVTPRPPHGSVRAPLCIRLLPRVFDGELAVCVPAPVTHFPGPEPGACFADPHSPWSLPFAPPTPQRIAPPCSPASQLLRQSPTFHVRASSAAAPRLPDAGQGVTLPLVKRGTSQLPMHSFCA